MSDTDLKSLTSDFLLENIDLAYQAIAKVPWGKQVPEDIFLNDILPYANIDETREDWRREMMNRCLPIVKDCKTPGEAALKLNRELFPLINVRYSTSRRKANQSPSESMDQSVASCTGLSIILTDACRSVGVPSRLAGIGSWTNKRGNHTWVEVWDGGAWCFTGAAEPADELNRAWFQADAALADNSKPIHRIYAVSFAKTDHKFPLVWSPNSKQISAVNVTARYTTKRTELDPGMTRVLVSLIDAQGNRLKRELTIKSLTDDPATGGTTRDESADMNDFLTLTLPKNKNFRIEWQEEGVTRHCERATTSEKQTRWEIRLE